MPIRALDTNTIGQALQPLFTERFGAELEEAYRYVDQLCLHFCIHVARTCNLLASAPSSIEDLAQRHGVVPDARFLLATVLAILEEEGLARHTADGWGAGAPLPDERSDELQAAARAACPEALPTFDYIERCRTHAVAFLTGEKSGLEVLLLGGDTSLWERLNGRDLIASVPADLLPAALATIVQPGDRVLELGSGVGSVIRRCLPLLRERDIGEYWFTDVGALFVEQGRRTYRREPSMRFATVDLNRSLAAQQLAAESVDVVVAFNTLHVAKHLAFTLQEIYTVLRRPGWLLLAEGSPPDRQRRSRPDLILGFLRGWWEVQLDPALRPRPGFLLPSEWTANLLTKGFDSVEALPGEAWFQNGCRGGIIVGRKGATGQ